MSRRTRDELRTLMIDAGCELVRRRGLAFDPPSLTYATVFQHLDDTRNIRLHRSQVHGRIWESQEHYRTEVVTETLRTVLPGSAEVDEIVAGLTRDEQVDSLRALVEGWVAASIGVSRIGADQDLGYDILVAAQALSQEGSSTSAQVSTQATVHMTERMRHNVKRYDTIATKLGLEFENDLGIDRATALSLLARNSSALVEGSRMMESLGDSGPETFDMLDSEGEAQSIDAATLSLIALVEQLFDLDR